MANKEQAKEQQPAVDEQTLSRLVPISGLTKQSVAQLAQKADVLTVKRGQFLFRKGDQDGLTTYILEGELELFADETHVERIQGGSESARHPVAQLQPRQYSARARTECKVIQIQRKLLDQLLALDQSGGYEVSEIEEEDEEDSGDWMSRLLQSELFQKIPTANIQKIFLHVEKLEVEKDAVIVRQGDEGDFYYFIAEGRCAVSRKSEEGREIKLAELRVGDSFGEEALIRETKRNATITMLTDGVLMRLTKDDFAELIRKPLLRTVTYAQGCGMIKLGAQWIDVRLPEEYEQGAIAESINLPLSKLRKEAERLERNRTYIVYCDSGGRSSVAAFLLNQLGFDVSYLGRGLDSCPQAIPKKTAETKIEVTPSAAASASEQPATAQAEQPEARLPTMLVPASGQSLGEREDQEDAFAVVPLDDQQNAVLLVVADGMGGHAAGEVASKSAVAALCDAVREGFPAESPPDLLRSALQAGNAAIKAKTTERPELQGMGSTLVAVLAIEHRLWWVSVGDSHLYLIRERQLRKLNADHSYGGYLDRMAEAGNAVEPDPRYKRNMLMSALTGEPIPEIDVSDEAFNLQLGDRLLLASDGVNSIGEGALIQHSAWSASSSEYTESLIQAVAEAKKPRQDNTTVAALDVVDREKQGTGVEVKKKQRAADQKVLKLNQQLSDASAKLAAALRQKAEAEAARQSAEQTIAERMKKVESQDDETRKAYEKQLREEQQRREEEIAEANAALDEAQRQRLAAEEARRQAESHAERVRAEEEEMRRRLQEETEERLAAERRKMEEEFARFSKQVEEAERARENAEQKLKDEQARAEQETLKATERMAEAERIRTQAEEARQKIEQEAQKQLEEAQAAEARHREELEAKLKQEQSDLERRLAKAEEVRQQAEAARQRAEAEAQRKLDEASQSGSKVRAELEEKLKAEQALLEERLAVAEKVRKDAEAARQQAEDEARKELERLAAEETEQRRKLEEDLKQKEAELEARLASSSTELEEAKRLREEAETARRESEQEAERVRAQSEAEQQRLQQEAEAKLREERQRMEAQFAETVDQLEEAKRMQEEAEAARTAAEDMVRQMRTETDEIEARARAEAEAKIAEERARLEQEFGAARQAVEEAKRIQQEAEEARIAIEEEAAVAQAQAEAAGESIRKELSEKLEKERQELSAKLEAANSQLAEAEAKASEAASAQQEVASEAARIRAAEEQARMQLQAEVEAQLRTERDKFQQELAEAKSRFESAEQAKIEAEARRIAAEQQAANLAEAERKAQESEQQEELTALQAERERMQAEIEKANAELKAAKESTLPRSTTRSRSGVPVSSRRPSTRPRDSRTRHAARWSRPPARSPNWRRSWPPRARRRPSMPSARARPRRHAPRPKAPPTRPRASSRPRARSPRSSASASGSTVRSAVRKRNPRCLWSPAWWSR
jgi:serine/threonine protein phosphatase PrpC/CRP-like cAMP-binding protein/rhodanese-related sulfurtransferase